MRRRSTRDRIYAWPLTQEVPLLDLVIEASLPEKFDRAVAMEETVLGVFERMHGPHYIGRV